MTIKEKSRFISQIENQLIPKNPKINIFYPRIVFENENIESAEKQNIVIKKNEFILKNIKKYLEYNGLSPTTLNNYIECPLRFYWLNVEKLKPENEISETIMVDTFGVILHAALELIDKDKGLKSKEELEFNRINIPAVIEKVFTELKVKVDNQQGINYLLKNVAEKLLDQYFEMRIANFQNPYEIIDNEIFLEYSRLIGDSRVKFKGTIDKIEKHGNTLELIDFKSGEVDFSKTGNKTIEEIFSENKLGKQRQLYFYIYLVFKNISIISVLKNNQSDLNLKARIYSFRNLTKDLSLEQIELKDLQFVKTIDETLEKIVLEILNPEVEIVQTEEKKNCQYCDFRNICKRE
ncbi:MAG: PD-(D/E)XK nuclease family protein [Cytophagaceae bacterium]|nr:PD-(D/E)XK nuclease family protein [Cytophagaceae bacterium]